MQVFQNAPFFAAGEEAMSRKGKLTRRLLLYCLTLLCWSLLVPRSHAQVTSNVYMRVLKIKVGNETGTGFTLDVDGRQYLVTAKHMVAGLQSEDSIEIFKADKWNLIAVKIFRCADPIDIAILVPPALLTVTYPLEPTEAKVFFGQDAYFVGFPFGLSMNGKNLNGDYPIGLVKKGTYSATLEEQGAHIIYLDGHNNFGFSGAPIVFRDLNQPNVVLCVVGVVSGFRPELAPVMTPVPVQTGQNITKIEPWRVVDLENGRKAVLKDTQQMVALNTGIVIGYGIQHAVDLIREHPIGPKTN